METKDKKFNFYLFLYLLSLAVMGSNGIVASFINLSSIDIVFLRTVIGSIVLIIACLIMREKFNCLHDLHDAIFLLLSGFSLGAGWIFLFEAYRTIGVSIATLLYYLGPMIAMILSPIFFGEKLTEEKITGAIIVAFGIVLLNGKINGDITKFNGIICGFIAGLLYAAMVILNKHIKYADGLENTTCQIVASFFLILIYMTFKSGIHIKISGLEWIPVLWIGIINTGINCIFYYSSITKLSMSTVAILSYVDPVAAVVLSMVILGERLTPLQTLGSFLVISGALYSQIRYSFKSKFKV